MGIIYELLSPKTGKLRYVGQTIYSPEKRLKGHIYDARYSSNRTHKLNWLRSVIRDGQEDDVKIRVIESCSDDLLDEREIYWIQKRKVEGYTLTNGTSGGAQGWIKIRDKKQVVSKIRASCRGRRVWNRSLILQFDMEGNLIKEWESASQAEKTLSIRNISSAANGTRRQAGGFHWVWKDSDRRVQRRRSDESRKQQSENARKNAYNAFRVVQLDLDENVINRWDSIQEAARSLGLSAGNISGVIRGQRKQCGGFKWKKDGNM